MKNFLKILFLLTVFYLAGCSPSPQKASEYNNMLIRHQRAVISRIDDLIASFTTYNAQDMQQAYNALIKQINFSLDTLQKVKPFDGSTEFRDKTISLIEFYKDVTENQLKQVMQLLSKPEDKYTSQDALRVSEIMSEVHDKITQKNAEFKKYQEQFARKYHLSLTLKE